MILYYFKIRGQLILRKLQDAGIPLLIGIPALFVLFYFVSEEIYERLEFQNMCYLYGALMFGAVIANADKGRQRFLFQHYPENKYFSLNIIENIVLYLPLGVYYWYKDDWVYALTWLCVTFVVGMIQIPNVNFKKRIPTPFLKHSLESIVGFRKNYLFFFLMYFVLWQSVKVQNLNLGLFCLLAVFVYCSFFFVKSEPLYYVWNYRLNPNDFLIEKLKTAGINSLSVSGLITIILFLVYPAEYEIIALGNLWGLSVVSVVLLSKYSVYPSELNLQQLFMIALCLFFPLIIPVLLFYFYVQACSQLKEIL
ncbi:hypothetical protein [Myroides indicus]|uniref:Uncharacterized protein n=1 Tax=Myroides indicus TaxID=1323422 RepID=A0A4R7ERE8_9FLAO|nr:hypothetical protein [Myroides indicus]TDS55948.1 hypothetical protein C8P70_12169 [Myroides indicus]